VSSLCNSNEGWEHIMVHLLTNQTRAQINLAMKSAAGFSVPLAGNPRLFSTTPEKGEHVICCGEAAVSVEVVGESSTNVEPDRAFNWAESKWGQNYKASETCVLYLSCHPIT
jgi:hypothetical protein